LRAPHFASSAAALLLAAALTASLAAPVRAQSGDASTPVPGGSAAKPAEYGGVSGFDVMTSTVFQEGQSSFSGFGFRLRLKSSRLVPNVEFAPGVEFWRHKNEISSYNIKTSRGDATLSFIARWTFPREHWQPYVGAGAAVHFLDEKVDAPDFGLVDVHDSTVRGGYILDGGVNFTITKTISNFLELEYHGVTDYRQTKFHAGVSWNF
jgi:opacity protein-like surface antigen